MKTESVDPEKRETLEFSVSLKEVTSHIRFPHSFSQQARFGVAQSVVRTIL